jgi:hypothetical protein
LAPRAGEIFVHCREDGVQDYALSMVPNERQDRPARPVRPITQIWNLRMVEGPLSAF